VREADDRQRIAGVIGRILCLEREP
jgi:hypothetical protein